MKKSVIATIVLLTASFFLFQNCGAKKTGGGSATAKTLSSSSPSGSNTINLASQEDSDVTLEIPDDIWADFEENGECKWSFTNASGETTELRNVGQSLDLDDVQLSEGGVYQASCVSETKVSVMLFLLMVVPEQVSSPRGTYVGKFILPDGSDYEYADVDNVTRAAALQNCKLNADLNPQLGIHCKWKNEVIFEREIAIAVRADFRAEVYDGDDMVFEISGENFTQDESDMICDLIKDEYDGYDVTCHWDGEVF